LENALGIQTKRRLGVAFAAALAFGLAACGADGEPLPPPGAQNPVDVNAPKPAPEEGERPSRRFILDGLL
jgi:predicted small lipoprotein YifL